MEQGKQHQRLSSGEKRVWVDYDLLIDKAKSEAAPSNPLKESLFRLFNDNHQWRFHASCADIDQTSGKRIMLVKCFDRAIESEEAIAEMDQLGYRPAIHLELYAFVKNRSKIKYASGIIAFGSCSHGRDSHDPFPVTFVRITCDIDGLIMTETWLLGRRWLSDNHFLFVRK